MAERRVAHTMPVLILPEGYTRTVGRDAQRMNILAAKIVAEAVRTTLGPKGMDKMLVDSLGDVVITNDGATILDEMEIEHPAAKMMVEIAKTQEKEVGDGTTTAVVLAGELLKNAEDLLEKDVHPAVICKGYRLAMEEALRILDEIGKPIDPNNKDVLVDIAMTVMRGKATPQETELKELAKIAVDAIFTVKEERNGKIYVDIDNIKLEKRVGGSVGDTELIKGVVLDKERVHPGMPTLVKNAKIALLNCPLEVKEPEVDARIQITSPEQMEAFLEQEEKMIKKMVEKLKEVGANVVICQKGIDEIAQHYLAKAGIFAVRRVKKSDMEKLARATGGRIVTSVEDLSPEDLGYAEIVEERKIAGESMTFVRGCRNPKSVTILIRGGSDHVVDEAERAMEDVLGALASLLKDPKIVGGGGAVEVELARRLEKFADKFPGREQLAIKMFAKSLETIPMAIAENAGLDPIDFLAELKARHERGEIWAGIDVFEEKVVDAIENKIIESISVKKQAIKSATEMAIMILRIDDVIAAGKLKKEEEKPGLGEEETETD